MVHPYCRPRQVRDIYIARDEVSHVFNVDRAGEWPYERAKQIANTLQRVVPDGYIATECADKGANTYRVIWRRGAIERS